MPLWCTWAGEDVGSWGWAPAGLGRESASWSCGPRGACWFFRRISCRGRLGKGQCSCCRPSGGGCVVPPWSQCLRSWGGLLFLLAYLGWGRCGLLRAWGRRGSRCLCSVVPLDRAGYLSVTCRAHPGNELCSWCHPSGVGFLVPHCFWALPYHCAVSLECLNGPLPDSS